MHLPVPIHVGHRRPRPGGDLDDEVRLPSRSLGWQQSRLSGLSALIGQLSTRSQEFRTRWAAHDVKAHRAGAKVVLTVVTPQPGSPEHDAFQLLASWNAHSPNPAQAESSSNT
jgi:hypothetical protein